MWSTAVTVTSVLWALAGVFLIYAASDLIIKLDWRQFVIAALIWIGVSLAQIVFSAIAE